MPANMNKHEEISSGVISFEDTSFSQSTIENNNMLGNAQRYV